jgi:hypothetical protein
LVSTDRPDNAESFDRYEADGIEVYVHKGISTSDGVLKFRLRRFLFFTEIEAVGVKVI